MEINEPAPAFDAFSAQLAMLLRDLPSGTTADLADGILAYWNGHEVTGIFTSTDDPGALDEDYAPDINMWEQYRSEFGAWLAAPSFTARVELKLWLERRTA